MHLYGKLFLGRDDVPHLELLDHRPIFLVSVTNVVFLYMFHVLLVDFHDNGFDHNSIDHLLKGVFLAVDLVVLLELEDLAPLGVVLNFRIEELSPFDVPAFKVLDPGSETHFGLGEHKREESVISSPFGGSEMACECCDLVNKMSKVVEGGLSHNCVEWDCFHPSPDHLGDGGHCCHDHRHDCAILVLTKIT